MYNYIHAVTVDRNMNTSKMLALSRRRSLLLWTFKRSESMKFRWSGRCNRERSSFNSRDSNLTSFIHDLHASTIEQWCNASHISSTLDKHTGTAPRLRQTSPAAAYTDEVANKPTHALPERRGGCEPWSRVVDDLLVLCCCCEPEFDPAPLESRNDALDPLSMLCIRVPSPLVWGRNNVCELRAQRRHVMGDGGRGSTLTELPFNNTIGALTSCCDVALAQHLVQVGRFA